jgi:hypothetical protein
MSKAKQATAATTNHKSRDPARISFFEIYCGLVNDPYPRDPDLLLLLAKALTENICRLNRKQGRVVRLMTQMATTLHVLNPKRRPEIEALFERISRADRERHAHWKPVVQLQRLWLEHYLESAGFMGMASNERRLWFDECHAQIYGTLSAITCVCRYRRSLKIEPETLETATGPIQLIVSVLHSLHQTKPHTGDPYNSQIYKLSK